MENLILCEKLYGLGGWGTGVALDNLGHRLLVTGDYAKAEVMLRRRIDIIKQHPRESWQKHAVALNNLAKRQTQ